MPKEPHLSAATTGAKLERIAGRHGIDGIYAFGSRARAAAAQLDALHSGPSLFDPGSDLDIGVRPFFGVRLTAKDRVELTLELEDLFTAPRVDLVILLEADPYLALEIVRGEVLYCADADEEARSQMVVLRRAADLAPFKRERMRMILEEGAR